MSTGVRRGVGDTQRARKGYYNGSVGLGLSELSVFRVARNTLRYWDAEEARMSERDHVDCAFCRSRGSK